MAPNAPPKSPKTRRRRWPWLFMAIALGSLAIGGLWIFLQITISAMVEHTIMDYAGRHGIEDLRLDVRQITPWGADIHALQVGNQLQLDSLVLDYSLASLKAHAINSVQLSGLDMRLEKTARGWILSGLPPRGTQPSPTPGSDAPDFQLPDWRINHLAIRNSRLTIRQEDRQINIPFEFQAQSEGHADRYRGQLRCQPWEQGISATFDLNLSPPLLVIEGAAASLDLQRLNQALVPQASPVFSGRIATQGKVRLGLNPFALEAAEFQIRLPGVINMRDTLTLQALDPEKPWATAKLDADRTWRLRIPGLTRMVRDQLQIKDWHGRLIPAAQGWRWDGKFDLAFHPTAPLKRMPTAAGNTLPVAYQGQWQADGSWSFSLAGQGSRWQGGHALGPTPRAAAGSVHFVPHLDINASGHKDQIRIEGTAQLRDLQGSWPDGAVKIPEMLFQADGEGPWYQLSGRYNLQADNLRINMQPLAGHLKKLAVEGTFATRKSGFQIWGQTRFSRGVVHLSDRQVRLGGLHLDFPFSWPYDPSTTGGRFHVAAASWKDLALGAAHGRIRQQPLGVDFRLSHQSPLMPGGKMQFDGRLAFGTAGAAPRVDIDYRFERASGPSDIDLGVLMHELKGTHFNGRIEAEGQSTYQAGQLQAGLKMKIVDGRLVRPEQNSGLVGLNVSIAFPDLLAMRSAPKQKVFFKRAYIGDIAATEGQLDFQIEPHHVLFLEQGRFKWCEGTVYLPATRVAPDKHDYRLTLWCDRLKLALLLEQFGAAQAEGGGTVSGNIPVRLRQGQLLIDNGFLFSSPGEGGRIRLRGTEMLTAGIPPGTPQYNQLELARQALQEYDYDWVKLGLETAPQEDLLRLKLQLNGRPAKALPFIYDTQRGGFMPAPPGNPGSRFEGIKLDVNFSLPLNRLLEYKDLLKLFS